MPIFTPFVAPPKPAKAPSKTSANKKGPTIRRRPLLDDDLKVYGDELFETAIKPAKIIYIGFHELINNKLTRISKCRRFVIEHFPDHHTKIMNIEVEEGEPQIQVMVSTWSFYYFRDVQPLMSFVPERDLSFTIPVEFATEKLEHAETLKIIEDKMTKIVAKEELENIKASEVKIDESSTKIVAGTTDTTQYNSSDPQSENKQGSAPTNENGAQVRGEAQQEREGEVLQKETQGQRFTIT